MKIAFSKSSTIEHPRCPICTRSPTPSTKSPKLYARVPNSAYLPHHPDMYHKPTILAQLARQPPVGHLPCMKQTMEALDPRLEHVRTPQLLCDDAQRGFCGVGVELAERCAGGV